MSPRTPGQEFNVSPSLQDAPLSLLLSKVVGALCPPGGVLSLLPICMAGVGSLKLILLSESALFHGVASFEQVL